MSLTKKIVTSGLILLGSTLIGHSEEKKEEPKLHVEEIAEREYQITKGKPPEIPKSFGLLATLEKTGISTEISISAYDSEKNAGIAKVILYEDGKPIHNFNPINFNYPNCDKQWISIEVEIEHTTSGKHTYFAEIFDRDNNKITSKDITIEFSGKVLDIPPLIRSFHLSNNGKIWIECEDYGDNKGLTGIILYKDDSPIKEIKCDAKSIVIPIPLEMEDSPATHTFHAEVTDIGKNTTKSKPITVHY